MWLTARCLQIPADNLDDTLAKAGLDWSAWPEAEASGYVDAALHDPGPATHDTGALVQVI